MTKKNNLQKFLLTESGYSIVKDLYKMYKLYNNLYKLYKLYKCRNFYFVIH